MDRRRNDARCRASEALGQLGLSVHLSAPGVRSRVRVTTVISKFLRRVEDKTAASRAARRRYASSFFRSFFVVRYDDAIGPLIAREQNPEPRPRKWSAKLSYFATMPETSRRHKRAQRAFFDPASGGLEQLPIRCGLGQFASDQGEATMNFASDNGAGVAAEILEAIAASSRVNAPAYGADVVYGESGGDAERRLRSPVAAFLVATGPPQTRWRSPHWPRLGGRLLPRGGAYPR